MTALDAWNEEASRRWVTAAVDADLIDAYAALKRAENGEVEDEHT